MSLNIVENLVIKKPQIYTINLDNELESISIEDINLYIKEFLDIFWNDFNLSNNIYFRYKLDDKNSYYNFYVEDLSEHKKTTDRYSNLSESKLENIIFNKVLFFIHDNQFNTNIDLLNKNNEVINYYKKNNISENKLKELMLKFKYKSTQIKYIYNLGGNNENNLY